MKDVLGFPVSVSDVVVFPEDTDKIAYGVVSLLSKEGVTIKSIDGENRFTIPTQQVCVVEKTRLREDIPIQKQILDFLDRREL